MPSRPSTYLNWIPTNNPSFITTPTGGQLATGWTANERPPYQYMNWVINLTDQWIQWFDSLTFASVGAYDSVAASGNGLVIAAGVIYAQSATASVPGMVNTGAQTFGGNKQWNGIVGFGGAISSSAIETIGTTNPLTGSLQRGSQVIAQFSAAATQGISYLGNATTAATAFTLPLRAQFYSGNQTKGAGSTITRDVAFFAEQPTQGTNNAMLCDNTIFSGNFFIHQNGSNPSRFNGNVTFNGDIIPTGLSNSSANQIINTSSVGVTHNSTFVFGHAFPAGVQQFGSLAIPSAGTYLCIFQATAECSLGVVLNIIIEIEALLTDSLGAGLTGAVNQHGKMEIDGINKSGSAKFTYSNVCVHTFAGPDALQIMTFTNNAGCIMTYSLSWLKLAGF